MNSQKKWWQSKTVWGGVVAISAGAAGVFGITVGPVEQLQLVEYLAAAGAAIGGLIAVYGRVSAKDEIG